MHTAVAHIEHDKPGNDVVQRQVPTLLTDTLNKLSSVEAGVINSLCNQTDEELLETRFKSKFVERFGWRVQCACDYTIKIRTEKAKAGRGNIAGGAGRNAALRRQAKKIGVTVNTIRKNANVHELILATEQTGLFKNASLDILDEKSYYIAALSANDPVHALALFVEKKSTLPKFRVSDAFRLLEREGLTKKIVSDKAIAQVRTYSRKERFEYLKKVRDLLSESQGSKIFDNLFSDCLIDVEDELAEMYDDDVVTAIKKVLKVDENKDAKEIALAASFPIGVVLRILRKSEEFSPVLNNQDKWKRNR